jgi:hypothetical protein
MFQRWIYEEIYLVSGEAHTYQPFLTNSTCTGFVGTWINQLVEDASGRTCGYCMLFLWINPKFTKKEGRMGEWCQLNCTVDNIHWFHAKFQKRSLIWHLLLNNNTVRTVQLLTFGAFSEKKKEASGSILVFIIYTSFFLGQDDDYFRHIVSFC